MTLAVRTLADQAQRAKGGGCKDRLGPLRTALADDVPRSARQLAKCTRIDYTKVCSALRNYPRYFRRANPEVVVNIGRQALWLLVPEVEQTTAGRCQHCRTRSVNRPRGLCWACYYTPEVSVLYPSTSAYTRRGVASPGRATMPGRATAAPPGSLAKMREMYARLLRGESLFHPADNPDVDCAQLHPFAGADYDGGADNGLLPLRGAA